MKSLPQYHLPRIALATIAVALLVVQWFCGDFPLWLFSAPMNLLVGALWIALLWEGYRRRASLTAVQYLLSPEASYIALAVATLIAATLGLQSNPTTTSWLVVGGFIYVQSVLILVILRGWRNENGIRWRFLATHCGLWLAVTSALLGAPDKEILRAEVGKEPTREVINEEGKKSYLNYELRLDNFVVENSEGGTPQMFRASVAIDDKIVDIEVNSPYSQRYGEDIYLVSYDADGCILQIVREPWRIVSATGIAILLLGAFMLFLQGFGGTKR
ncbi:MAG: cytochrome c biogenesis protein ResB [Alistipes sp.]|nr:cytochrome c biogenesis protein ResB [Alistipes sp.]